MATGNQVLVRLEDGKGFWRELELDGTKLTQRSAAKEGESQQSSTRFESLAEARDQLAFLVGRYLKQGFKEVSRTSAPVRPPSATVFVSHPEYEAACLASPHDPSPWKIYADWLQEQGDPRGELAALFLDGQDVNAWDRLESERDVLVGPHSEQELSDFEETHGFLRGAVLKIASGRSETRLPALTKDFLERPAARFVSELEFGFGTEWAATVKVICEAVQAPQLRKLHFTVFARSGDSGDLSPIWKALPSLEDLRVNGPGAELGRMGHQKLKAFVREAHNLRGEEVLAITRASFPALERLEFGTASGNRNETIDSLAELLEGNRFPRLTHLAVRDTDLIVPLLRALGRSPLVTRLKGLDLSNGALSDADVDLLLSLAPKLAHLELNLSENRLLERIPEVRRALPRAVLKNQLEELDRYDDVDE